MLSQRQLGKGIGMLENYLLVHPRQADMNELVSLRDDYHLMASYWQRGFDDPQREQVYDKLLKRLFALVSNVAVNWQLENSPFLKALHLRPRKVRKDWSMTAVRTSLEEFVSELAMLSLEENEEKRRTRTQQLHSEHWDLMRDLFDYVLTSRHWRESLANAFLDMLLSPTLASIDQQLLVSAITLAAMQNFCYQKFRVLTEVYARATDEQLRQRALVGWVLCADDQWVEVHPEMRDVIGTLCADEQTRTQLAELQMQLMYCQDADADRATIQKEILPDIINGSNLKVTKHGLVEMDEDSLEEILHPEASEQAMERMEQSVRRMADMQRQGADIYFGGFSQMKRFPFFNDICNWLLPFYPQHPGIAAIWNNNKSHRFLKAITRMGAFCDSDKYSFVLAFEQVLGHLPHNVVQMIEQGEAAMPVGGEVTADEQQQPAFIRRVYLQNLYRFFRLFPARGEFRNPFGSEEGTEIPPRGILFFASSLMGTQQMVAQTMAVARFLLKRHQWHQAAAVLLNIPKELHDYQYYMMMGTVTQHLPEHTRLSMHECYHKALECKPDSEKAQAGLARALFNNQAYEDALEVYERLLAAYPDHRVYQLNAAVCMANLERADEALKLLYRLSYQDADDIAVNRVLAWTLTLAGKYEQADKLYCKIIDTESPQSADMLNYGYNLWLSRHVTTAIGMFRQFMASQDNADFKLYEEFMGNEHQLLGARGITDTEIRLMADAVLLGADNG